MARQTSFGDALASARERKGLDLSTAARKLRIRPDILRAIEEGDFSRMPPRGYTSNMVGAYARLVGLNPTEMTRAYREEAYQFETGRRPVTNRGDRARSDGRTTVLPTTRTGSRRTSYRDDYSASGRSTRSGYGSGRGSRSATPQPQYTNLVQGRQAPGIVANLGSMLPLIIVGAIIVGLLVLVIVLAFGNRAAPEADAPVVPVSGMPNPAGTESGGDDSAETPKAEPVAPTSAEFTYTILDGEEVYIEVIEDDATVEAGTFTGPKTGEYDVTGTLTFVVSGYPESVELTVDGEKVEPVDENQSGVYTYTVDFEKILKNWEKENGVVSAASSSKADSKDAQDDTTSAQSDDTDGAGGQTNEDEDEL